ncbi:MAG: hypothetical protein ACRD2G_14525 [Terriglobia bacterium]
MTKYVRIDYTIKPDVDLGEVKAAIGEFVASIASHHPDHRYTSYQSATDPRRFVHIAELVEDAVADFQTRPFFLKFSEFLHEHCATGPDVTLLTRVASARVGQREC